MKRIYPFIVVAFVLSFLAVFNADTSYAQSNNWCGTDILHQKRIIENPQYEQQFEEQMKKTWNHVANYPGISRSGAVNYIPVVIHVIHDNGTGNVSKAQIDDAITVINEDFRRQNADATNTRAIFVPHAADSEFEFRLAQKDPNGNCTNGIVRVNSTAAINANDDIKFAVNGGSDAWPTTKYFNIWVVNSIDPNIGPGVLGYAYLPYNPPSWSVYGVMIKHDQFGRIGTSNADGRTLTHEIGHALGLLHTFQDGCGTNCSSTGDWICDTPPTVTATWGCNNSQNTCGLPTGPDPYGTNVVDQIENYMSYDNCQNMYSDDQKAVMKANIASISQLQSLVSGANLTATGTDGNDILCAADFSANNMVICAGDAVQFYDESYHGQTTWSWSLPGGAQNSSTQQNPNMIYWSPGVYDVSLTAGNGVNTVSTTKTSYITVLPSPGYYMPYSEGFEGSPVPNADWVIYNPDGNFNTWEQTSTTSYSGGKCLKMRNFANTDGALDEVMSPSIDLSTITSANITFQLAFAQRDGLDNDNLKLYASTNCGVTWALRWAATGAGLASVPLQNPVWTPASQNDWDLISVSLPGQYHVENFRFKFVFTSNQGNNLYIDDINITGNFDQVPLLISPADGTLNTGGDVTIDWKSVGGVDEYEYQLADNIGFSSPTTGIKAFISNDPGNSDTEYDATGLSWSITYYWRVRTKTGGSPSGWSSVWDFKVSANGVGLDETPSSALNFSIYPNPVENNSVIQFSLYKSQKVSLVIYDLLGKEITSIVNEKLLAGDHQFNISSEVLNPGFYLVRLLAEDKARVAKVMVK